MAELWTRIQGIDGMGGGGRGCTEERGYVGKIWDRRRNKEENMERIEGKFNQTFDTSIPNYLSEG